VDPNQRLDLDQATRLIESERAQIGHEIHDGLLPLIFAASAAVSSLLDSSPGLDRSGDTATERGKSAAADDPTQAKLQQVSTWLGDAMQAGRRLLTGVYPPELTGTLWTKAAQDTLARLFPEAGCEIRWQVDPQVDQTSAPVAFAAYRITIEAVRNAIGHGGATEVDVVAERAPTGLRIQIRDNGCGFDPAQIADDRFGIRSMRGRAELVGGSLQLESQPGGPSSVVFTTGGNA
jgi:signal transduction histidine kinase